MLQSPVCPPPVKFLKRKFGEPTPKKQNFSMMRPYSMKNMDIPIWIKIQRYPPPKKKKCFCFIYTRPKIGLNGLQPPKEATLV